MCYGQVGAPVYEKINNKQDILETRMPGENVTTISQKDRSEYRYLGVILPHNDPQYPEKNVVVVICIDGSATLFEFNKLYKNVLQPESKGLCINTDDFQNKNRLLTSIVFDSNVFINTLCDVSRDPDRMTLIIGQAVDQAQIRKQKQTENIAKARPNTIAQLRKII